MSCVNFDQEPGLFEDRSSPIVKKESSSQFSRVKYNYTLPIVVCISQDVHLACSVGIAALKPGTLHRERKAFICFPNAMHIKLVIVMDAGLREISLFYWPAS